MRGNVEEGDPGGDAENAAAAAAAEWISLFESPSLCFCDCVSTRGLHYSECASSLFKGPLKDQAFKGHPK